MTSRRIIPVLLVLATLLTYGRIVANRFVLFDDTQTLFANPLMKPPTWQTVVHYWSDWQASVSKLYTPVTYTAWAGLAAFGQVPPDEIGITLNPAVFHAASVLVHALAVLAVYGLIVALLGESGSRWAAAAGALIFGLHPVQVEAVAWASGLKDVLCGMFSAVALWQYVRFVQRGDRWRMVVATLAFVAGLLSKPTAVVVPVMAAAIDYGLLRNNWRVMLKSLTPWVVLSAAVALLAAHNQPARMVPAGSIFERLVVAGYAIQFYLGKILIPVNLTVEYGKAPALIKAELWTWLAWIIPATIGVACWRMRAKVPGLWWGGVLFVTGLLPVLGLRPFLYQQFTTVADHYLYLPMMGVGLAVAVLVVRAARWRRATMSVVVAWSLMLAVLSIQQAGIWRDTTTLFEHNLRINPRSWFSYNNLAVAYTLDGQLDRAMRATQAALDIVDDLPPEMGMQSEVSRLQLGEALLIQGRHAEAAEQFEKVLRRRPGDSAARAGLEQARQGLRPREGKIQ